MIVASLFLLATALPVFSSAHYVESSPHGWCSIDINYPQLSGLADTSLQSLINRRLYHAFVELPERDYSYASYFDAFGSTVDHPSMTDCEKRMVSLTVSMRKDKFGSAALHASYDVSEWYRIGSGGESLFSFVGDGVEAVYPSAHPTDYWWTVNIDMSDGKVLGFNDIFRTDVTHAKRLDDLIAASLHRYPDAAEDHLVSSFRNKDLRGRPQPLVCPGGITFFNLIDVHAMAAVAAFVSRDDLIAAGVVKNPLVLEAIKEPRRAGSSNCG